MAMIYSIILITMILITGFFFSLTGIQIENFLTINIFPIIEKLLSINFLAFIIFASASLAIIEIIIKKFETKTTILFCTTSYLLGVIITCLLFNLIYFLIPLLFGVIGLFFATMTQNEKEKEYKTMAILRSGISSAGKIILFVAIGTLLFFLIINIQNQSYYEESFTKDFLNLTIDEQNTVYSQINEPFIDSIIEAQKQTINSIKSIKGFQELENKNDVDVLTFVAGFNNLETTLNSENYRKTMIEQIENQQSNINFGENILNSIPLITQIAKYSWLFYTLFLFAFILMIGNILIKNIAGIIYAVIVIYFIKNETEENNNY